MPSTMSTAGLYPSIWRTDHADAGIFNAVNDTAMDVSELGDLPMGDRDTPELEDRAATSELDDRDAANDIAMDDVVAEAAAENAAVPDATSLADLQVISDFAAVLQSPTDDYLGDRGTLAQYAEICRKRLKNSVRSKGMTDKEYQDMVDRIRDEAQTWELVRRLLKQRLDRENEDMESVGASLFLTEKLCEKKTLAEDSSMLELQVVKLWLEAALHERYLAAPDNIPTMPYRRTAQQTPGDLDHATDLDPDAAQRTGRPLFPKDEEHDEIFFRNLFELVQTQPLRCAIDYAQGSDRPFVAACLQGGLLHHFDVDDTDSHLTYVEGNLNRRLWKQTCRELAKEPLINKYERAVYSLLAGYVDGVLPVCDTYEAVLHAFVTATYEARLDAQLLTDNQFFFVTEPMCTDADVAASLALAKCTFSNLVARIKNGGHGIHERAQSTASSMLAHVQGYLVSGDVTSLVTYLHTRMHGAKLTTDQLRFAVHLTLALRDLKVPVPLHEVDRLVQTYVDVVMHTRGVHQSVPIYVQALPASSRVSTYAAFVGDLEIHDWAVFLDHAAKHAMDVPAIVQEMARLLFKMVEAKNKDGDKVKREMAERRMIETIKVLAQKRNVDPHAVTEPVLIKHTNHAIRLLLLHAKNANRVIQITDMIPVPGDVDVAVVRETDLYYWAEYADYRLLAEFLARLEDNHSRRSGYMDSVMSSGLALLNGTWLQFDADLITAAVQHATPDVSETMLDELRAELVQTHRLYMRYLPIIALKLGANVHDRNSAKDAAMLAHAAARHQDLLRPNVVPVDSLEQLLAVNARILSNEIFRKEQHVTKPRMPSSFTTSTA
ncbi:hypothetical protein AMAG_04311 [Allomyces macrogynus ATCC 38327]|uniref:Nuclear pore complex protein n=1 Tax=Allomyces macrogynus (strain ATCC 38327) TaxID=578462 RepID=A0A0L0S8E3_ALLM3|nr:hypothetical protein AMAG_04311 [Allomyces macrogynus ATCC 38327]|eukprot:KNE58757.1 hypothetical protein AMAG_04311 [Allomyces macrogynus ATCC 38327]